MTIIDRDRPGSSDGDADTNGQVSTDTDSVRDGDLLDDAFAKARETTIGKSIFRSPRRVTPRDRAAGHWSNFLLHIYPVKMRRKEVEFRYSWYLGVISTVLFGSLIASGIYLMFFYVPSPASAYGNIQHIQTEVPFGQYIRNVHRWSAHLMVLAVAAHMARVFYRGAYKPPREFNWVIGVVLLLLTLLMSFTGYLLPWDQLAYWAVTVGTEMAAWVPFVGDTVKEVLLGGPTVDSNTLLRFYVLHVAVLPAAIVFVLMIHLWRWRKDSMLATTPPDEGPEDGDDD
jgi:quinol-cytochrome oxidoreductase complex cytochrome b subunit